jgi:hypothetical protein
MYASQTPRPHFDELTVCSGRAGSKLQAHTDEGTREQCNAYGLIN